MVEGLHLLELANLKEYGHYTTSPRSLFWLMEISECQRLTWTPLNFARMDDLSPKSRATKETSACDLAANAERKMARLPESHPQSRGKSQRRPDRRGSDRETWPSSIIRLIPSCGEIPGFLWMEFRFPIPPVPAQRCRQSRARQPPRKWHESPHLPARWKSSARFRGCWRRLARENSAGVGQHP